AGASAANGSTNSTAKCSSSWPILPVRTPCACSPITRGAPPTSRVSPANARVPGPGGGTDDEPRRRRLPGGGFSPHGEPETRRPTRHRSVVARGPGAPVAAGFPRCGRPSSLPKTALPLALSPVRSDQPAPPDGPGFAERLRAGVAPDRLL